MRKIILTILAFMSSIALNAETVNLKLETSMGNIHFELYADKAPETVANFLRYIDSDLLKSGSFYRVVHLDNQQQNDIKIEVIQGGLGFNDDARRYAPIGLETTRETGLKHIDGTLSMARGAPDTATSEFFICINEQPSLDYGGKRNPDGLGFAAFGRVTQGMEVVRAIQKAKTDVPEGELEYTSGQMLTKPVKFLSFTRE